MNPIKANRMLMGFQRDLRLAWLRSIKKTRSDFTVADVAAEQFASSVIRAAIEAGYAEATYLRSGVFDPSLSSANGLRMLRQSITARFLRDVQSTETAGLNARQREDVRTYRRVLQGQLDASIDGGHLVTMKPKEIEAQVARLENRLLELRARTIALDQASTAYNLGVSVAHQQMADMGMTSGYKRYWLTASDEKVRSSHAMMNGQVRAVGEAFISGNGYALMRPHDPNAPSSETANCRCMVITERVKA
jgi:hypothetical protein